MLAIAVGRSLFSSRNTSTFWLPDDGALLFVVGVGVGDAVALEDVGVALAVVPLVVGVGLTVGEVPEGIVAVALTVAVTLALELLGLPVLGVGAALDGVEVTDGLVNTTSTQ